jgi:outer membrane protein assembly factor BamB
MTRRLLPLLAALAWAAGAARAADWSHWRGPHQNGVADDKGLPEKWSPNAKAPDNNLVWRVPFGGRTTPVVQNGRVYIINKSGGEGDTEESRLHLQERVMCFDADSGKALWEYKFNVWHTDIVAVRLGWTNMVGDPETGNVYAHGTQGLLFCFDKDGKIFWQHSLTEEYGRISGYGGRVTSPIIDGDLLILSMLNASWGEQAIGGCRFVAFDKRTGQVVWWASTGLQPKDTYYSVPVVAEIGGQRLLISGGGDGGVHAFKVRTGEHVWSYVFGTGAVNCSPVVDGNLVYIGHGEDNADGGAQGRVVCVDGSQVEHGRPKLVWKVDGIKAKYTSPVLRQGRLYITDEIGRLFCLDGKDGKQLWAYQYGKNSRGSPVLADGKIYIGEVDSRFHILRPEDDGCKRLHSQFFRKKAGGHDVEINGSPAVANGRIYFMTTEDLYCIGKKDAGGEGKAAAAAAADGESAEGEGEPAHLQVVPADVALHPGESVELKARAFDVKGRPLGDAKVEWSLAGMRPPVPYTPAPPPPPGTPTPPPPPALQGRLSETSGAATTLTVNTPQEKAPPAQFGRVVAKLGQLTADVRVRVAPTLPYRPNFDNIPEKRTPGGWVNTQGKFEMVGAIDEGGKARKILRKTTVNPSPLVARANAFIGMPDCKDYTIQADVQGSKSGPDLPDMGVVANRYTLMLAGNTQQLRLVSWDAIPRVDRTIYYTWSPGVWYRMKLTVAVAGGKATVRGKVWPRGGKEPEDWAVEVVDPVPNTEGAPALYGYAAATDAGKPGEPGYRAGTNIYFENVTVTPNAAGGAAASRADKK